MSRTFRSSFCLLNFAVSLSFFVAVSCVSAQTQEDAARGQAIFNSGTEMLVKGEFAAAISKFTEVTSILPAWHLPYLNRGIAYLSLMKLPEAEADADKALSLIKPETTNAILHSATAYQIKGTIKQHLGDHKGALEQFSLSVDRVPTQAMFHNSRGNAFRLLDRNDEALASYSKAIELDPRVALFYVNRAGIYERLKDNLAALRDLDEALKLDKGLGSAYYTRALLKLRAKAYAEALADFDEAIRLEPVKSAYFHGRGLLHHSTKKFELAIRDHTHAITLDPKNSYAFSDRALAYGNLGNTKAAIDDLKSAISLNSESSILRYNLGYFLFRNAQYSGAIEAATQAIERAPNWKGPYLLRSNAYVKIGAAAKAKADRDRAATLSSSGRPTNDKNFIMDLELFLPEETKP